MQRERDFGKEAAPAHGAHARVVGGGRETTHRNAELQDRLQAPAGHGADGETITRDAGDGRSHLSAHMTRAYITVEAYSLLLDYY